MNKKESNMAKDIQKDLPKEKKVKVEFKNKDSKVKKISIEVLSWIVGLYLLGALLIGASTVTGKTLDFFYNEIMSKVLELNLESITQSLISPVTMIASLLPVILPSLIAFFIFKALIDFLEVFSGKSKKAFLLLSAIMLSIVIFSFL